MIFKNTYYIFIFIEFLFLCTFAFVLQQEEPFKKWAFYYIKGWLNYWIHEMNGLLWVAMNC